MNLGETKVLSPAFVAYGAGGPTGNGPHLGPLGIAAPAATAAKLCDHGAARTAGNRGAFDFDAHTM